MRTILLICIGLWFYGERICARQPLSLDEAVCRSLAHKPSLQVLRLQTRQQQLSEKEAQARWWPEISFAYDYRYNPVVATTIIPIGQFDINNPTNTVRGIKMGTKWQQNGGFTISQPLIDWSVIRNVKRARLATELASTEQKIGRDALIYETARSYLNICRYEQLTEIALNDTLRTATTLREQQLRYQNEQLLVSDLNRALINHNDALNRWQNSLTDLIAEKLYLAFLTGIPNDSMLLHIRFQPESIALLREYMATAAQPDSLPELRKQEIEQRLAIEDLRIAKARNIPTLSLEGFIGANQYNDCLSPFERDTWYGSSYVGISVKIPLLYQENFRARNRRIRLDAEIHALQQKETRERYHTDAMVALQRSENLQREIDRIENNRTLEAEVLRVLSKRFSEQRASAFELNLEELEYLKMQQSLQEKYTEQILQSLDYLKNTGLLYLLQSPLQPQE